MALTAFESNNYVVNHAIDFPDIVCVLEGDTMVVELDLHPVTSQKILKKLALTSPNAAYVSVWKNATNVAYSPVYDQITGLLYAPGPLENNVQTYIQRHFCMSLQGTPGERSHHLHVYVGASVSGGGGDPDDGSWTGDTP